MVSGSRGTVQHAAPDLVSTAVYGLPEVNRVAMREAVGRLPGCYPTAVHWAFCRSWKRALSIPVG